MSDRYGFSYISVTNGKYDTHVPDVGVRMPRVFTNSARHVLN